MIDALTEAGNAFENMDWIKDAQKAMDFILAHASTNEGKLFHTLNDEKPKIDAFLEDYACMIKALISLGSYNEKYFLNAHNLLVYVLENFSDPKTHMFSFTSAKGEKLVAPYFDFQDNVIPASNSIMARNLFYLGNIFEEQQWIKRSENMLRDMEAQIAKHGRWTANWGILGLHHQKDFYTLAVRGKEATIKAAKIRSRYLPDTLLCISEQSDTQIPVLQNRYSEEETLIYPCTLNACLSPQTDVDEALKMING